jgi:Ca2+/Na+ antiporter
MSQDHKHVNQMETDKVPKKRGKARKPNDYKMSSKFNQIIYALIGIIFIVFSVLVFVKKSKLYVVAVLLFVFYVISLFLMKNITEYRAAKYFLKGINMEDQGDGYSSGERVINIFQPKVTEMKEESKYSTVFLTIIILGVVVGGFFLLSYLTSIDFFA